MRRSIVTAAIAAAASLVAAGALSAQDAGSYTKAQATAGGTLYASTCSSCHGAKLEGGAGPALTGADFHTKWDGQTADDLNYVISSQMPLTAPGSLKPDQDLALVAYILQQNGMPAGDTPLTGDKLKTIKIKKP